MRQRFVQIDGELIEVSADYVAEPRGPFVMPDIAPYQAVAVDRATGTAPVITSRSRHREFLKRNGYIEIGNEKMQPRRTPLDSPRAELAAVTRDVLRKQRG